MRRVEAESPRPLRGGGAPRYVVVLLVALLAMAAGNVAEFADIDERAPYQYKVGYLHPDADLRALSWETTATTRKRFAVYLLLGRVAEGRDVVIRDDMAIGPHHLMAFTRPGHIQIADYDAEVDRSTMRELREAATWRAPLRHELGHWAIVEPEDGGRADMVAVTYGDLLALVPAERAAELGVRP